MKNFILVLFFLLIMLIPSARADLVAHWELDWEQDSALAREIYDSTGNGFNGKMFGAEYTKGKIDTGLRFNGRNSYVRVECEMGDPLDISDTITIAAWIKTFSFSGQEGRGTIPICKGEYRKNGWCWWIDGGGWRMSFNDEEGWDVVHSGFVPPVGQWHHLVSVIENNSCWIKFFIDGEFSHEEEMWFPFKGDGDRDLFLGKYGNSSKNYSWDGIMDDVRIYNEALSNDKIKDLYIGKSCDVKIKNGDVVIIDDAQYNTFIGENYTQINGDLIIFGTTRTDIQGLDCLSRIGGNVVIVGNNQLDDEIVWNFINSIDVAGRVKIILDFQ